MISNPSYLEFSKCKQAQDTTVEGLDAYKKQYRCGGALNPKDAKEQRDLAMKKVT